MDKMATAPERLSGCASSLFVSGEVVQLCRPANSIGFQTPDQIAAIPSTTRELFTIEVLKRAPDSPQPPLDQSVLVAAIGNFFAPVDASRLIPI